MPENRPLIQETKPSGKGCPTGKRMFGNQRCANRAVTNAAKRGELPPMKHYLCPRCNHWHLAKKRPVPSAEEAEGELYERERVERLAFKPPEDR